MAKSVGMSKNNTTLGKNILYFMSRYHIHISSKYHFRHIHSNSQPQNNKPLLKKTVKSKRVEGYPIHTTTVTISHCAFLFTHPYISFQHRHCHPIASTFHTFTPSNVLFHPFMLNLLFAYPINLINTNVGPTIHPFYMKFGRSTSQPDFDFIFIFYLFNLILTW